jgi:hypothetical protein
MARLCERPGCSAPADVSYGFDADTLVVWLDTFQADTGARAGVLCRRHADAMVVPLGWMLDDRRDPVPRLFRAPAETAARPVARRVRHERPVQVQLSLEADDATGELIISPQRLAAALALDITAEIPRPDPVPEVTVAPETRPVLAVVESAPPRDEQQVESAPALEPEPAAPADEAADDDAPADDVPADDAPADDAGDDTVILPWQPRFDQNDDLHGLLRARGRLLSRAFRGQTAESG